MSANYFSNGIFYLLIFWSIVRVLLGRVSKIPIDGFDITHYYDTTTNPQSREVLSPRLYLNETFIKIGGLFSMVDPDGSTLYYSMQRLITFQCTIQSLNRANMLKGRTLIYEVIDVQRSAEESLAGALSMLQEQNIVMVVGPGAETGESAIPVASILTSYNVSGIAYDSTGSRGIFRQEYGFARTNPTDEFAADAAVALCLALNWTLVTPIFVVGSISDPDTSYFTKRASDSGMYFDCTANIPGFYNNRTANLSTLVLRNTSQCLLSSQSKVVVLFMPLDIASSVVDVLLDTVPGLIFVSSTFSLYSSSVERIAPLFYIPPSLIGSIAIVPPSIRTEQPHSDYCPDVINPDTNPYPPYLDYLEHAFSCYLSQNRTPPGSPNLPICPNNISMRNPVTISCICTGNENINELPIDPRSGYVADAVLFYAEALNRILNNCSSIPFGNYCNKTYVTGLDVFRVGNAFPIEGTGGRVQFIRGDRVDPIMDIIQVQSVSDGAYIPTVGNYSNRGIYLNYPQLYFNGSSVPVSAITPHDENLSDPLGIITLTAIAIFCAFEVFLIIVIYKYREAPIVKRMSPTFCILIVTGVIIALSSIIIWTIAQTSLTCVLRTWTFVIGTGLILINLLAKTYRIYRIFHRRGYATIKGVSDKEMLRLSAVILFIDIALLLVYTFVGGIPTPTVVHLDSNYLYAYVTCEQGDAENIAIAILLVFNLIILFSCAFFAYRTRNIDKRFNESRRIAIVVYFMALVVVISIAVYYSVINTVNISTYHYVTQSYSLLLTALILNIVLFGPIIQLFFEDMYKRYRDSIIVTTGTLSRTLREEYPGIYQEREDYTPRSDSLYEDSETQLEKAVMESSSKFVSKSLWRNQTGIMPWLASSDSFEQSDHQDNGSATLSTITSQEANK